MPIQSFNPATNTVEQTFTPYAPATVETKLAQAAETFATWRTTSFAERAMTLRAAATHLRTEQERYAQLITTEMGKPITAARAEIEKCAAVCEYYAEHGADFLAASPRSTKDQAAYVVYEPMGVILAVMPWNFPFWQVIRFAAPALLAGNVGVLKHASNVPQCALAIEETFQAASNQTGLFTTLLIESSAVADVIRDPRVAAVTLTGSEKAGASVASTAASEIKKSVLELGGSDPFIVRADVDIPAVAKQAALARFQNCGQSCIAAKRFIVHETIAAEFTKAFVKATEAMQLGDPTDDGTAIGPLVDEKARTTILQQIKDSVAAGATLETGGTVPNRPGSFLTPAVLSGVKPGMPLYDEETFGPAAAIISVKDDTEAVAVANDTLFGLGASIWTNDQTTGEDLAQQIESGSVFLNTIVVSDIAVPFGGNKRSGYGRELAEEGIKEFVNVKTIKINPAPTTGT